RGRHVEGLVRPLGVVGLDPGIELLLRSLEGGERASVQELLAKALVEPLDLAGGRGRARSGVTVRDPVLTQDPVEQDLDGVRTVPAGEDLPVVGEDLVWDAVAVKGRGEHRADGLRGRS